MSNLLTRANPSSGETYFKPKRFASISIWTYAFLKLIPLYCWSNPWCIGVKLHADYKEYTERTQAYFSWPGILDISNVSSIISPLGPKSRINLFARLISLNQSQNIASFSLDFTYHEAITIKQIPTQIRSAPLVYKKCLGPKRHFFENVIFDKCFHTLKPVLSLEG